MVYQSVFVNWNWFLKKLCYQQDKGMSCNGNRWISWQSNLWYVVFVLLFLSRWQTKVGANRDSQVPLRWCKGKIIIHGNPVAWFLPLFNCSSRHKQICRDLPLHVWMVGQIKSFINTQPHNLMTHLFEKFMTINK